MEEKYSKTSKTKPSTTNTHHTPSKSELLSSAKVIADAAKSTLSHDKTHKVDKAKVAGAAANLVGAAKQYGKFDEKNGGLGSYIDKAEGYLHQYNSSHSSTTTTASGAHGASSHDSKPSGHSSGGAGEYIKLAQGFLKKQDGHSDETHGHSSGGVGAGDYIKLAQGFLNKH